MKSKLKHCKSNDRKPLVFVVIIALIIVLSIVVYFIFFDKMVDNDKNKVKDRVVNETSDTCDVTEIYTYEKKETTISVESSVIETTEHHEKENSEKFDYYIAKAGYIEENIKYNQLIIVESHNMTAILNCFEKRDGVWEDVSELDDISGYVGIQGVSLNASEYESYTPKGLFGIGTGFGICDDPGTGLDYFKVTQDSYWVDDVDSAYYNQHVEGLSDKDWLSAEHLIDYPGSYNYCVFIEYNSNPVIPGKGSAFFLHVGTKPTAGCVAVSESSMINILKWLQKDKSPAILIY